MGTRLRTTLHAGSWAVFIGLAALLLAAVLVPRAAGASTYTVLTGSMRPHMEPGALAVVRPTDADDIGVGSVITYQLEPGKPSMVTHRVVEQGLDARGRPVFRTEGDANGATDANWVRHEQVRGTIWYALPYVGYIGALVPNASRQLLVLGTGTALLGYAAAMFLLAARGRRRVSHA
jgi:signal peptidase I